MISKATQNKKFFVPLIILAALGVSLFVYRIKETRAIILPGVPVTVVGDVPFTLKEEILDVIVRSLARNVETKLQNEVLDRIRTYGRDGGPAFVQDWRQFLQGGQYRGENVFRAIIADATGGTNPTICEYLRGPLSKAFNAKTVVKNFDPSKYRIDSTQYFKIENKCTLPVGFDVNRFRQDFSYGGWAAFNQFVENPQNNFFGVYLNSINELSKQREFEEQTDKSEAESGGGFTSKRDCEIKGFEGSSPSSTGFNPSLSCLVLGQIKTPAQILGATVQRSIDEDFSWITSSDELSELLAGVANSLFNSLINKIDNLAEGSIDTDSSQTFDPQACLDRCVENSNLVCQDKEGDELAACQDDILNNCVNTCAASNTLP